MNTHYNNNTMTEQCFEATYISAYYDDDMITGDYIDNREPASEMRQTMAAEPVISIDDLEPELAEYLS